MYDDVSILIVGFDRYIDVWNHSIDLLNKYWNDRPTTYLVSSTLKPSYQKVNVLCAGDGAEWSLKVRYALEHVKTKYVILMLEDFFVSDYVDNVRIQNILKTIHENRIKFYQLSVQLPNARWEKGAKFNGDKNVKVIPADKKYGLNLQAAIWDTDFLRETVGSENYNAWKFEINQLERKDLNDNRIEYLIDVSNPLNITHMIVQSKYLPNAVKKMKRIGCVITNDEREQMSFADNFKYNFKLLMYAITPKILVKPFKAIGRMFKIDFVTDRIKD